LFSHIKRSETDTIVTINPMTAAMICADEPPEGGQMKGSFASPASSIGAGTPLSSGLVIWMESFRVPRQEAAKRLFQHFSLYLPPDWSCVKVHLDKLVSMPVTSLIRKYGFHFSSSLVRGRARRTEAGEKGQYRVRRRRSLSIGKTHQARKTRQVIDPALGHSALFGLGRPVSRSPDCDDIGSE
jgi:hypothetical protein